MNLENLLLVAGGLALLAYVAHQNSTSNASADAQGSTAPLLTGADADTPWG